MKKTENFSPKPKSENFQGEIFVFKKVSENKNKTNNLINLEWCYYFKFFSQLLLLLLSEKIHSAITQEELDLKMEKVKNFQRKRNYLESEKFFSKFSYSLEREKFPKP